jgi:hypothetical protein
MIVLRKAVAFVCFLALLALALTTFISACVPAWWVSLTDTVQRNRVPSLGSAVVVVGLSILFALAVFRRAPGSRYLVLQGDGGGVGIRAEAIAEYLTRLTGEFPSITSLGTKIIPHEESVDVDVDVCMKAGPQIREICEQLQRRVRESLATGLGITQVGTIEVRVKEIG